MSSGVSRRPARALLGVAMDEPEYSYTAMTRMGSRKFRQNFTARPLCVDPESPAWIGFVYAMMAGHADYSFEERRAFARAGFTAIFGPVRSDTALNFCGLGDIVLKECIDAAAHAGRIPSKTRRTFAGLRDAMSLPALIDVLCFLTKPETLLYNVLRDGRAVAGSVGESTVFAPGSYKANVAAGNLTGVLSTLPDAYGMTAIDYLATLDGRLISEIADHVQPKHRSRAVECLESLVASAKSRRTTPTATPTTPTTPKETPVMSTATIKGALDTLTAMMRMSIPDAASALANYFKWEAALDGSEASAEMSDIRSRIEGIFDALGASSGQPSHEKPPSSTLDSLTGLVIICRTTEAAWGRLDTTESDAVARNEVISKCLDAAEGKAALPEYGAAEEEAGAPTPARPRLTPDPKSAAMLDAVLSAAGLPTIEGIDKMLEDAFGASASKDEEIERLRKAAAKIVMPTGPVAATGTTPTGKIVTSTADKLFKEAKGLAASDKAKLAKLTVPCFEWDAAHPLVPAVDENYIFRMDSLLPLLFSLAAGKKPWIQGHTGSGKSTLVTQVAARLGWPVVRVNFDSDISRLDLVGRDTLTTDPTTGTTITKWVDGVLPLALRGPHILLLDEIDFVRPDVSYVLQPILEGNPLVLNENGGERVVPDPMFRIVATANTVGQGDEFGMYQGARPQSAAMLDRFSSFIKVPYLSTEQEVELIKSKHPTLDPAVAETIGRYVTEHREAFGKASILMPISPRGVDAIAEHCVTFTGILGNPRTALKMSFDVTLLAKASEQDRTVIAGLMKRVIK
jgi:cobaltochelatase CobS